MMAVVPDSPAALGFITINIDPVLRLGPLPIHWYGIMYAVAFLVAYQFGVLPYAIRRGIPKAVAEKITVCAVTESRGAPYENQPYQSRPAAPGRVAFHCYPAGTSRRSGPSMLIRESV